MALISALKNRSENETKIRFAGAVISQRQPVTGGQHILQQRLDEVVQVIHLLQLAPAVLIQLAVAGGCTALAAARPTAPA